MIFKRKEDDQLLRNASGDLVWRDVLSFIDNNLDNKDLDKISKNLENVFNVKVEKNNIIHFIKLMTASIAREERANSNKKTKNRTQKYNSIFNALINRIKESNED